MRAASLIPVLIIPALMVLALPASASSEPPTTNPSAATASNEANWAEFEAQARITDGDYDGAVQAEQRADAARKQAEQLAAGAQTRPPSNDPGPTPRNPR